MILILFLIAAIIFTFLYQGLAVRKSYYTFRAASKLREVHHRAIIDLSDNYIGGKQDQNIDKLKSIIVLSHFMSISFAGIDGLNFTSFKKLISILIVSSNQITKITVDESETGKEYNYIISIFDGLNTGLMAIPANVIKLVLEVLKIAAIFFVRFGREKIRGYINQLEKFMSARSTITHNMCGY